MSRTFYITTPIYYVNDVPHIGHAYTTVACDVAARYHRQIGDDVYFLTGTDEHGMKIERAAHDKGETPQQLADRVVIRFQELWKTLGISHNDFIRTTEERHKRGVHKLFRQLRDQGDIYLGEYEGWYCTPCESFWTETQVGDEIACPDCGRNVEKLKEQSYFFKMSAYAQSLMEHIKANPDFIQPASRRNEIIRFIESGLKDLSISRTSFDWGIKVPDDPAHVIYVWFDALSNYMTALGYESEDEKYRRFWPANVHMVGKDILRFHTVYWPTFLLAAGLPLPKKVFAHGWWTIEGKKMSKSLMNVVDPTMLAERFGIDPIRYFLLREVPFGMDGDFSMQALVGRINSDLANDLGNLLNRISGMMFRYCEGKVPLRSAATGFEDDLIPAINRAMHEYTHAMEEYAFHKALIAIWDIISLLNKYIVATEPWTLKKNGKEDVLATALCTAAEGLRLCANAIAPFMPESSEKIAQALGIQITGEYEMSYAVCGAQMEQMPILFERVELTTEAQPSDAAENSSGIPALPLIEFDQFLAVALRAGKIVHAEKVQKSSKLLKLSVDLGEGALRTIVSGIAQSYAPEELVDKTVSVVANLKPAKLMGIESNGMILAAKNSRNRHEVLFLHDVAPGTEIK